MKKGFTLVELLVVIAIMSILTVITVAQFRTAGRKANDVARKGDLNSVAKALQMYYTDYGKMPDADTDGQIVVAGVTKAWGQEFNDAAGYVYMKKLPQENKAGWIYCYKTDSPDNKKYALFANLENTMDSQCDRNKNGIDDDDKTYLCGAKSYCFAYVSPNTSLDTDGNFQ